MRELTADDFVFEGPLGCAGATIERLGTNHFLIKPGHGPGHPEWTNVANFAIRQGARGNALRVDVAFDGVDMNRSYHPGGSDATAQTREAYLAQRDLETIAEQGPLGTVWSMHTWQGLIEPLIDPAESTETRYGSWEILRDAIVAADTRELIKPLRVRPSKFPTSWTGGPREQFGVSAILCEGVGLNNKQADCLDAGRAIMQGLAHYCSASRSQPQSKVNQE